MRNNRTLSAHVAVILAEIPTQEKHSDKVQRRNNNLELCPLFYICQDEEEEEEEDKTMCALLPIAHFPTN